MCLKTKSRKAQRMTQCQVRTTIQDQKRLFINYTSQHPAYSDNVVVFQLLSCVHLFAAPWTVACQASLSFTISPSLLNFVSIESAVPSNHLILCCLLLLLPSIFPSIRVFFQWVGSLHQVAKVLEFQLQHQSFQWIFRVDFLKDWVLWSPCCPQWTEN